jgi:hypothetical protein
MASLIGQNIGGNPRGIINLGATINSPLSTTLQSVTDGMGNNSPLQLSTDEVGINRTISLSAGSSNVRLINETYTINNSGAQTGNVTGIFLNATETALNGMGHNLLDLQVGGVSKFKVFNSGGVVASGVFVNGISRSFITSPSDGIVTLYDSGATSFNRLQFGGTTSAFPSIKRNGASIDFRLADDSNYCAITASNVIMSSGSVLESLGNVVNLKSNLAGGSGFVLDIQSRNVLSGSNVEQGALTINVTKANTTVGTANFRLANLLYTINNTAAQTGNATGIFLNATETALNGMGHNLMDLQVGGVSKFYVSRTGAGIFQNTVQAAEFYSGNNGLSINGQIKISSTISGIVILANGTTTDFNRLQFGGTTNAFPAIKRNGAGIDFKLADDSGFCNVQVNLLTSAIISNASRIISVLPTARPATVGEFYQDTAANILANGDKVVGIRV